MHLLLSICSFFPHQIFEEGRDLSGKYSQVEEACGDFIVVLGQVAIPQVLQQLNIMLLVFHMCCKKHKRKKCGLKYREHKNSDFCY